MEMYIPFIAVAWILAGLVYADCALRMAAAGDDAGSHGLVAGIRQLEMASLAALAIFILIWPLPLMVGLWQWWQDARRARDAAAEQYIRDQFGSR